jgi:hypothetical protein
MKKKRSYFTCPHCGESVPSYATSCPGCGSDMETGWSSEYADEDFSGSGSDEGTQRKEKRKWTTYLMPFGAGALACLFLAAYIPWIYALGLAGVLIAVCAFLVFRKGSASPRSAERRLRKELLSLVGGDKEQAKRLVTYERMRSPDADILDILDNTIWRLRRDRR